MPRFLEKESDLRPGETFEVRQSPFPGDFHGRLVGTAASFNLSTKATALLLIDDYTFSSQAVLASKFRSAYANSGIGSFNGTVLANYVDQTLGPIGFVANKLVVKDNGGTEFTVGYGMTEAGRKYGKPVAAAVLDFERRNGFSLFPVLGKTATRSLEENRAPTLRALLLTEVAREGAQTVSDIAAVLETDRSTVNDAIKELTRAGVISKQRISYTLTNPEKLVATLPIRQGDTVKNYKFYIGSACLDLAAKGIEITPQTVYDVLKSEPYINENKKVLRRTIAIALKEFSDPHVGYLTREVKNSTTEVTITEKGEIVVDQFLLPLFDALQDGPTLQTWTTNLLPQVKADLSLYAHATGEYVYPFTQAGRHEQRGNDIAAMLKIINAQEHGEVTQNELAEALGIPYDTVYNHLQTLQKEGLIGHRENERRQYMYFPLEQDTED